MSGHTVKSFSAELEELSGELARMGGLVEDMLNDGLSAMINLDMKLAAEVVARDAEVDTLQADIEKKILSVLALRQPLARDLRQTIVALKVASDLERVGDLAKNIARRTQAIGETDHKDQVRTLTRLGRLVSDQLCRVLDAFNDQNEEAARAVWRRDEEIDEQHNSFFRIMLTYMMEDPRTIGTCTHLLFVAKNLERIGDHCTNIAETILFLITGEHVTTERPKANDL